MGREKIDTVIINATSRAKGIVNIIPFSDDNRKKVLEIEEEAEKRAFMGFGNVVNTGVRDVLACELIYVALTNRDFVWGGHASLVMEKGETLVGEVVQDKNRIAELSQCEDVWFMQSNFVIYKDGGLFSRRFNEKYLSF